MPQYDFKCQSCDHVVILDCMMKDYKAITKCPDCKKHALIRDYSGSNIAGLGEPTTLGRLGEQNFKKMGNYERDSVIKKESDRRVKQDPEKVKQIKRWKKLDKMTPAQKHHYIMTGKGLD